MRGMVGFKKLFRLYFGQNIESQNIQDNQNWERMVNEASNKNPFQHPLHRVPIQANLLRSPTPEQIMQFDALIEKYAHYIPLPGLNEPLDVSNDDTYNKPKLI